MSCIWNWSLPGQLCQLIIHIRMPSQLVKCVFGFRSFNGPKAKCVPLSLELGSEQGARAPRAPQVVGPVSEIEIISTSSQDSFLLHVKAIFKNYIELLLFKIPLTFLFSSDLRERWYCSSTTGENGNILEILLHAGKNNVLQKFHPVSVKTCILWSALNNFY